MVCITGTADEIVSHAKTVGRPAGRPYLFRVFRVFRKGDRPVALTHGKE